MPRQTDTDLNRGSDDFISFSQLVDCPSCDAPQEVTFPTEARDEDGLADIEPGDLTTEVACACGHTFTAEYDGWLNYGSA